MWLWLAFAFYVAVVTAVNAGGCQYTAIASVGVVACVDRVICVGVVTVIILVVIVVVCVCAVVVWLWLCDCVGYCELMRLCCGIRCVVACVLVCVAEFVCICCMHVVERVCSCICTLWSLSDERIV